VTLAETGESYACHGDESVLNGMARLGKRGIPVGCRGGGCGVCKVAVLLGSFRKRVMSRSHVSEDDEARQHVLACCIFPESDLTLKVIGGLQKAATRPALLPKA
jgi:ferredoxin